MRIGHTIVERLHTIWEMYRNVRAMTMQRRNQYKTNSGIQPSLLAEVSPILETLAFKHIVCGKQESTHNLPAKQCLQKLISRNNNTRTLIAYWSMVLAFLNASISFVEG